MGTNGATDRPRVADRLTRRGFLATSAGALLAACTASSGGAADSASGADRPDTTPGWLSGGTAGMRGGYGDPFEGGGPTPTCTVTCDQTLGPCHVAEDLVRRDVSEGRPGLPVRLAWQVVTAGTCAPLVGATVEIWHTDTEGVYSGDTGRATCYGSNPVVQTMSFCRGAQVTDGAGRVDFDTIYPGWYPGRTTHIHVRVLQGDQPLLTSQVYFQDALSEQVYREHPDYRHRPERTADNTSDVVLPSLALVEPFIVATRWADDGALVAWMQIAAEPAAEARCYVGG